MRSTPCDAATVGTFLAEVADADGHPPLSEHKVTTMGRERSRVGVWSIQGAICLVGVASQHDLDGHWAVEAALSAQRRTSDEEDAAVQQAVGLAPTSELHTFWAFRPGQIDAARRLGYVEVRSVLRMSGPIPSGPAASAPGLSIARMTERDIGAIVAINDRAFADHPEQGSMTVASFHSLMKRAWFDPEGVLVARWKGRIGGFCVTKYETGAAGEVHILAVDPEASGSGLGKTLAHRGLLWSAERGAVAAQAWVDETNRPAVGLYRALGLAEDFRSREFIPANSG